MEYKSLYNILEKYSQTDYYPFHMPGHKRNEKALSLKNPYLLDITEIEGFDNLHYAQGIIKECEEHAADLYKSEETHYLINGSTVGILSAIAGCTNKGDKIIMARNCHKSAYHGVFLGELKVEYIYPQTEPIFGINGGLSVKKIEEMLIKDNGIKAILITSPTYDGVVSNVKEIANISHKYNIPLIVDEAHGAHFGFHSFFPESSIKLGADIVIHSLHKTLPSLTQTALIHINGSLVDREKIRKFLAIYQSSSPSYLLMSSIDQCINKLDSQGEQLFSNYVNNLYTLREKISRLRYIKLVNKDILGSSDIFDLDCSKLILSVKDLNISGYELYEVLLKKYHLQMEMVLDNYVLGMTSIFDTEDGFLRLISALEDIEKLNLNHNNNLMVDDFSIKNNIVLTIYEAEKQKRKAFLLEESIKKVSAEFVYVYPPGIPILVPGEEINRKVIEKIKYYKDIGLSIEGMADKNTIFIKCCI